MNPTIGKSVTINLTANKPVFDKGHLVRIMKKKRVWGEVVNVDRNYPYETTLTIKPIYRPAPKSRLNNKGKFSKHKIKIIKIK